MKPMRKVFAGILVAGGALVVATVGASTAAAADDAAAVAPAPGAGLHGWGHGPGGGHLFSKLGLSAEQQASIKAIMTAAKPQMKSMHDQMRANHLKLMQTKPDDPNYGNVVAEVAQSNPRVPHTCSPVFSGTQRFVTFENATCFGSEDRCVFGVVETSDAVE